MKLLVITQAVDRKDPVLGFFHSWLLEFANKFDSVEVICLKVGDYDLPKNVRIYSLGKENKKSKLSYIFTFYKYLLSLNGLYDKVFVHMNEEYIILAGLYWKLKNISVYFWRNHPRGSLLTRLSVMLSKKVFCTSTESFTARFKKTKVMPVGVDTELFFPVPGIIKKKYSVCMVGRVSPIKNIFLALESMSLLVKEGIQVSLTVIGSPTDSDQDYFSSLKNYVAENKLTNVVSFLSSVEQSKLPEIYSSYEICLNLTETGSFDKTIAEAASCGTIPLVSNSSLSNLLPQECITRDNKDNIAKSIKNLLEPQIKLAISDKLAQFAKSQSLHNLVEKLYSEMN